jgi:hypothetical protein
MEARTYEVPICDMRMQRRNKIFFVRVNENGEILEYMAQNIKDFRSVTERELRQQISDYMRKLKIG